MEAEWTVEPRERGPVGTVREIWQHRRFVAFIGYRALRKTYARTALGWLWLFITPLFPALLRALVFGGLIGMTGDGVPYFLFLMVGTVCWDFFSGALMWGTRGLEMNRGLVDQVYLPRILMPLATMAPAALTLLFSIAMMTVTVFYYIAVDGRLYLMLGPRTLWGLYSFALTGTLAVGIVFFTSVWGEIARDARFVMSQVLTVWFLVTPILYPMSALSPETAQWMLLNPLAAPIETFKWSLLGVGRFDPDALLVSTSMVAGVFLLGLLFFSRVEMRKVDEQ